MFKSVNSNAQFLKVIYFQKLVSLKESYSFLNLLCDLIFYFNPIQKLWIISWSISEWFYRLSCEFYFGSETMWNIKSCLTFLTTGNFLFIKEILFNYKIKKRKKKQNKKTINSDQIFSLFLSFIFFFLFFSRYEISLQRQEPWSVVSISWKTKLLRPMQLWFAIL